MRILATLAAAAFLAAATVSAHANPVYSSIVVYGDSLSDNGNLYRAIGYPPYPYVNGRFSNGPVAVEQLAANLGTSLVDFAYGGATTGVGNIVDGGTPTTPGTPLAPGAPSLPGMLVELEGSAGLLPPAIIPTSLFMVWGGADDFESLYDETSGTETTIQTLAAAQKAVTDIDEIIAALKMEGATSILVPNLPDLGETPEFTGNSEASIYSNAFNSELASSLHNSGVTLFNTDALFNSILAHPGAYGFSNTTAECIQVAANPACTGYLFFDDIHPTTAADTILARDFEAALNPTPEPSSLVLLGTGMAGAVALFRRRKARG